jgi:hypothetical protein
MSYRLNVYEGSLEQAFLKADKFMFDKYYDPNADYVLSDKDLKSLALIWWQIEYNSKIIYSIFNDYEYVTELEFESETDAAWWVLKWS